MRRIKLIFGVLGFFLFTQVAQAQWTPAKRITWTPDSSKGQTIAVDSSGHLHVLWYDYWEPGNTEIYYKKSPDGGTTWTAGKRLTWTSGGSYSPAMAIDSSGNLQVVWEDSTPGNSDIYYKKSPDAGASWTAVRRLTWTSGNSHSPTIAADPSSRLHLVWDDDTPGNSEIYYKKSPDAGATWTAVKRFTWTSGTSSAPDVAADTTGNLYVLWNDNTPGSGEIYYKKSPDAGASWTAVKRLTWNSGYSASPAIGADASGTLHVVWYDYTPGNWEIYYRNGN